MEFGKSPIDLLSNVKISSRSFHIGFVTAADYKYLFWTTPDTSPEYESKLKDCHRRAADRVAQGCIENGGLYIKMGQGMVSADHILPKEYTDGLRLLQDRALRRQRNEVIRHSHEEDHYWICRSVY